MPTGQRIVLVDINSLLNKTGFKDYLTDYFSSLQAETLSALLQGGSGTLDSDTIDIEADGADQIKLNVSNANKVAVGGGQVLTVTGSVPQVSSAIPFENTNTTVYHVGLSYAQIEGTVGLNRKQIPEYQSLEDQIGRVGIPDTSPAPVDTPNTNLRLYCDDLTKAGETHAGRKARVWLATPVSADSNTAFYEATIGFDGTNNYIDIPYSAGATAGPLGQDTSASAPSTTPSDYKIWVKGPRIDTTDFSGDSNYAYLGTVTGAGSGVAPTVFSMANQFPVFLFSLDRAYDGAGGGGGRVSLIDSGAVEYRLDTGVAFDPNRYGMIFKDPDSNEIWNMSPWGRVARTHRFEDDFLYRTAGWAHDGLSGTIPVNHYAITGVGGALTNSHIKPIETTPDLGNVSGVLELVCDGSSGFIWLDGPGLGVVDQMPAMCARIAVSEVSDQDIFIGWQRGGGTGAFGFYLDDAAVKARTTTPGGTTTDSASLGTLTADTMVWLFAYAYYDAGSSTNYSIAFWFNAMSGPAVVMDSPYDFSTTSYETWDVFTTLATKVGGVHTTLKLWIDYWEWWTRGVVMGL